MSQGDVFIAVPQIGPDMQLRLVRWYVRDGHRISVGDAVCELETQKATLDVEVAESGTLKHEVPAESTVMPGQVIGRIVRERPIGDIGHSGDQ